MPLSKLIPRLVNIRIHPIKSLDPVYVSQSAIGPAGGLVHDRAWALHSVDGKWVTATRAPVLHLVRANYSSDLRSVTLSVPNDRRNIPTRTFAFPDAHEEASEWFSVFFDQQIIVHNNPGGFPDDPIANGPTIVSTSSLRTLCEWFPEISLEEARQRFRTNLEIDLVPADSPDGKSLPAFWEDRLFGASERSVVRFALGEVQMEGSNPCARCPVPPRNPHTGLCIEGFQKKFSQLRQASLPTWAPRERFDHFYRFAVNTRVASSESNKPLRLNDPLIVQ